ncbi:MAG: outer membrane beta-barrel protein, partial [Bacteroidales bacterium]|nr:outer membrane beta-barrel protein [Bacteroidales bacterium]
LYRVAAIVLILLSFATGYYIAGVSEKSGNQPVVTNEPVTEEDSSNQSGNPGSDKTDELADNTENNTIPDDEIQEVIVLSQSEPVNQESTDDNQQSPALVSNEPEEKNFDPPFTIFKMEPVKEVIVVNFETIKSPLPRYSSLSEYGKIEIPHDTFDPIPVPEKASNKPAWAIGAEFAPVYSYRTLDGPNNGTTVDGYDKDALNNNEDGMLAYSGGMNVNYKVSKKLAIQSGVYYSRMGITNNNPLVYKDNGNEYKLFSISSSTGDFNSHISSLPREVVSLPNDKDSTGIPGLDGAKLEQSFEYIEVPLKIRLILIDKKFGLNMSGSLLPGFLVGNNNVLEVNNERISLGQADNLNKVIYSSAFSVGLEYGISSRFRINLEPTLKYSLTPINKDSDYNYNAYSIGWMTGILYRF